MLSLQKATAEDDAFLYEVYAETRAEEFAAIGWGQAELEMFLRMQFDMQKRSYLQQYPASEHQIVLLDGARIGLMITEESEEALLLIDLSLLSAHQNQGIGSRLIRDLQSKANDTGQKVRLHVLQHNPARHLYTRLGFRVTGEPIPYLAMEWQPQEANEEQEGDLR